VSQKVYQQHCKRAEEEIILEACEVVELKFPGELIGKEVIDSNARRIGVVKRILVVIPQMSIRMIVQGKGEQELPISEEDIAKVSGLIQLNKSYEKLEEIDVGEVSKLRVKIFREIQEKLKRTYGRVGFKDQ